MPDGADPIDHPVVRLEGVALAYEDAAPVLHDVDLTLVPGSYHFLTGASGAGKSSLLALIYLDRRPTAGHVRMMGEDVTALSRRALATLRRRIGVVFQDFRLIDHLSALDNVALPLRLAGERHDKAIGHARELLEWVGLRDRLHARPATLSGGEKQRIAVARAVIGRPDLLVADEPTGSIDEDIAHRLMLLFEELNRLGTTVVVATHNRALVERFPHPEIRLGGGGVSLVQPVAKPVGPA